MIVRLRFYGFFKEYINNGQKISTYELPEPITVKKLCDQIDTEIIKKGPGIIINGKSEKQDYLLREGDTLEIIPIFEGG